MFSPNESSAVSSTTISSGISSPAKSSLVSSGSVSPSSTGAASSETGNESSPSSVSEAAISSGISSSAKSSLVSSGGGVSGTGSSSGISISRILTLNVTALPFNGWLKSSITVESLISCIFAVFFSGPIFFRTVPTCRVSVKISSLPISINFLGSTLPKASSEGTVKLAVAPTSKPRIFFSIPGNISPFP